VGDLLSRLDCPPPDGRLPLRVTAYDVRSGRDLAPSKAAIGSSDGSCFVAADAGRGVSIVPVTGGAGHAVIAADLWMPNDVSASTLGLTVRLQGQNEVRAELDRTGRLAILERAGGTDLPALGSYATGAPGARVHRLVLAVSGSQVRAWVDGREYGPVTTTVLPEIGDLRLSVANGRRRDPGVVQVPGAGRVHAADRGVRAVRRRG